jgi:hypothetical protein
MDQRSLAPQVTTLAEAPSCQCCSRDPALIPSLEVNMDMGVPNVSTIAGETEIDHAIAKLVLAFFWRSGRAVDVRRPTSISEAYPPAIPSSGSRVVFDRSSAPHPRRPRRRSLGASRCSRR